MGFDARGAAVSACCFLMVGIAGAQITIEHHEMPSAVGDTFWYKYNTGHTAVNVGQTGGPHHWDFDTSAYVGWVADTRIVDKTGTPFAAFYPDANLVHEEDEGDSIDMYTYEKLDASGWEHHGQGWVTRDTGIAQVYDPVCMAMQLPASLGTTWQTDFGWTDSTNDSAWTVFANSEWSTFDAWGTATCPASVDGTFDVLRKNTVKRFIMTMYFNGMPFLCDTSWTRMYNWFAEGVGLVATAKSLHNDTSMVFDSSDCYTVLINTNASGITEQRGVPWNTRLVDGFVSDEVFLRGGSEAVMLDASGRRVAVLVPGRNTLAGIRSGVYFVVPENRSRGHRLVVAH